MGENADCPVQHEYHSEADISVRSRAVHFSGLVLGQASVRFPATEKVPIYTDIDRKLGAMYFSAEHFFYRIWTYFKAFPFPTIISPLNIYAAAFNVLC